MNLVLYTAMHGRRTTVKMCIEYLLNVGKELEKHGHTLTLVYGYTDKEDGDFLRNYKVRTYQAPNSPLWEKFHGGMQLLKKLDFDLVFMFGSDDIADTKYFLKCIDLAPFYGHIGVKDIYFYNRVSGERYYWPGYFGRREGEPAGAGKVYTKAVMEAIDYKIFQPSIDKGLDLGCWQIMKENKVKTKLLSVKEGFFLCDVKDGQGLTPTHRFINLVPESFEVPEV